MLKSFRGDTIIYTNNGPIRIDKITNGDLVLNNKGTYTKVKEIVKNKNNKKIFKLKLHNNIDNFMLTKNTQIYSIQNIPYNLNINKIPNHIEFESTKSNPQYVPISELTDFDYIGYPIPEFNMDDNTVNEEFFRFYGILLYFNFNNILKFNSIKNKNTIQFVRSFLNNNKIKYEENESTNNNILLIIIEENSNIDKNFNNIYNNINKINSLALLTGFLETSINEENKQFFYYKTNSKNIVYIIKFLLLKFGILISTFFYKDQNNNNISYYVIRIPKTKFIAECLKITYNDDNENNFNYFVYNNYIWSKIKNIEIIDYINTVYMLLLEDNIKEYVTDIGLVNNIIKYN